MKKIEIINPAGRGGQLAHCIKANYWKVSTSNFVHKDGLTATGVIEYEDTDRCELQER